MRTLIINADDFGASSDRNDAIMALMDLNLCLDTTLLVNFEASSAAAIFAIKHKRKNSIGIHLNLTEGFPITNDIKNERRFCNSEGSFHYSRESRLLLLSKSEKRAVYSELLGQIRLCRKFGIPISHADSHNHVHEEPGLFKIFVEVIRKEKIPYLRPLINIERISIPKFIYRTGYNFLLSKYNLAGVNYFGSTDDFRNSIDKVKPGSITEIMIHPGQIANSQIFDVYTLEDLTKELPNIIRGNKLISYSQLL